MHKKATRRTYKTAIGYLGTGLYNDETGDEAGGESERWGKVTRGNVKGRIDVRPRKRTRGPQSRFGD